MRFLKGELTHGILILALGLSPAAGRAAPSTMSPDWPQQFHDAARTGLNPLMPASFKPPLVLRWLTSTQNNISVPFTVFNSPVGSAGRVYVPLRTGQAIEQLLTPTGAMTAIFKHPDQQTWSVVSVVMACAAVFKDMVVWGLGGNRPGMAGVKVPMNASSTAVFTHAGPPGVNSARLASSAVAQGLLVSGDISGKVFCLDQTGKTVWSFQTGGSISAGVAIAETLSRVFAPSADGTLYALDLYSGSPSWTFQAPVSLVRSPSTDGQRVYLPSAGDGILRAIDATTGALDWVALEDGQFFVGATPSLAGGKLIWRTTDEIMAMNPADGSVIWSSPTHTLVGSSAIGNGYAWNTGNNHLEARRLADGYVEQDKTLPFPGVGNGPALLPDVGGMLVTDADGGHIAGFANEALPLAPQSVQVTPHNLSFTIAWSAPPPAPVDPPVKFYLVCRQGEYGTQPVSAHDPIALQEAVLNMSNGEISLAPAGTHAVAQTTDDHVIRLPDNRTSPPSPHVTVVPATPPTFSIEDSACNPAAEYTYDVVAVDEEGAVSPPASGGNPSEIGFDPVGTRGTPQPGEDWTSPQFDAENTGWNPLERLSWAPGTVSLSSGYDFDAFLNRFEFKGPDGVPPGTTFTQPVVSQGLAYTGGSDGRMYALNAENGQVAWWIGTGGAVAAAPEVYHSRDLVNGARVVVREMLAFASADDHWTLVSIDIGSRLPLLVQTHRLPGHYLAGPVGNTILSRDDAGHGFLTDVGAGQSSAISVGPGALLGPKTIRGYAVLDNANQRLQGLGDPVLYPEFGILTPALVRATGLPYLGTGIEILVAGFRGGWYALVEQPMGTSRRWVPLYDNPTSSAPRGGIVIPFETPPGLFPAGQEHALDQLLSFTADSAIGDACGFVRPSTGGSLALSPPSTEIQPFDCQSGGPIHISVPTVQSSLTSGTHQVCTPGTYLTTECTTSPPMEVPIPKGDPLNAALANTGSIDFGGGTTGTVVHNPDGTVQLWVTQKTCGTVSKPTQTCRMVSDTASDLYSNPPPADFAASSSDATNTPTAPEPQPMVTENFRLSVVAADLPTPVPAPTMLLAGETSVPGLIDAVQLPYFGGAISRGHRYTGGDSVVARGWTAPLALKAVGKPIMLPVPQTTDAIATMRTILSSLQAAMPPPPDGGGILGATATTVPVSPNVPPRNLDPLQFQPLAALDGVTLTWTRPPGYDPEGYEVFRYGPKPPPNASGPPMDNLTKIGTVVGGDVHTFTDTSFIDAGDVNNVMYVVRAYNHSLPAAVPPDPPPGGGGIIVGGGGGDPANNLAPRVGALSMVATPVAGQVDALVVTAYPEFITTEQVALFTIRATFNGHLVPGVPVQVFLSSQGPGDVLKLTLDGPPLVVPDSGFFTMSTDVEGKINLVLVPGAQRPPGPVQLTATVARPWATNLAAGFQLVARSPFVNVIRPQDAAQSPYDVPEWDQSIAGYIRAQLSSLVDLPAAYQEQIVNPNIKLTADLSWTNQNAFSAGGVDQSLDNASVGYGASLADLGASDAQFSAGTVVRAASFYELITGEQCQSGACSLPVNTYTGSVRVPVVDLALPGPAGTLTWIRTFSSRVPAFSVHGFGWLAGNVMSLKRLATGDYEFHRWDATLRLYRLQPDGSFAPPAGSRDALTTNADGTATIRSGTFGALTFDPQGRLVSIQDRNGNAKVLRYSGTLLHRIEDATGQFLEATYDSSGRVATVRDSLGRTVTYSYDAQDNLTHVVRPGGEVATYQYDDRHRLVSWHDPILPPGDKRGRLEYDAAGRVTRVVDGEGDERHRLTYTLNADGTQRTQITEACCGLRTDDYDIRGMLTAQTDALGHRTECAFNDEGRLTRWVDRNGHSLDVAYDAQGYPATITDALGHAMHFEQTNGLLTATTDRRGNRSTIAYDGQGRPVLLTDATNGNWRMTYDGDGHLRERTDALGRTTKLEWNDDGTLASIAAPLGRAASFSYDQTHALVATTDAKGRTTRREHDDRGMLSRIQYADGTTRTFVHDADRRLVERTDEMGRTTHRAFDLADRLRSVADPLNRTTLLGYDDFGLLTSRIDPLGHETRFVYDPLHRMQERINPLGQSVRWERDPEGNVTAMVDPGGFRTEIQYDALNRPVQVTDARHGTWKAGFDEEGNRTSQTDANGHTTALEYDALNRRMKITDPLGRETKLFYDSAGNLTSMVDGRNVTISATYDAANRLIHRTTTMGEDDTFEYDQTDRLIHAVNSTEEMTYTYDQRDRLLTSSYPRLGRTFMNGYDPAGRLVNLDYPDGSQVHYERDADGEVVGVQDSQAGRISLQYDQDGRRIHQEWPNGIAVTDSYDAADRLLAMTPDSLDPKSVPAQTYTYDVRGLRTSYNRTDFGQSSYQYDELGQLIDVAFPDGRTQHYSFDPVGNRLLLDDSRGEQIYSYDPADQLLRRDATFAPDQPVAPPLFADASHSDKSVPKFTTTWAYDGSGNEVEEKGPGNRTSTFAFNGYNRIVGITEAGSSPEQSAYDPLGLRATETDGSGPNRITTRFLRDSNRQILVELNASGTEQLRYIRMPGGSLLARVSTSGNRVCFYHFDALGSVIANSDTTHQMKNRWIYDPYGEQLGAAAKDQTFGFGGLLGVQSLHTNQLEMGFRSYRMDVGRFMSQDPLRFFVDREPISTYAYASNAPVDFIDPKGLWSLSFEAYAGVGGGVVVGKNPSSASGVGGYFVKFRVGVGCGEAAKWDPNGKSPDQTGSGPNVSLGGFGNAGVQLGPIGAGTSVDAGGTVSPGEGPDGYGDVDWDVDWDLLNGEEGLGADAAAGIELSLH